MIKEKLGDRRTLTGEELRVLDGEIIPTAHRWLRECPHLAEHAIKTLTYWQEKIVDDYGQPYVSARDRETEGHTKVRQ